MDLSFLNIFKDSYQVFVNIFIIIFIGFLGWKTLSTLIKKKLDSLDNSKDEAQTQRINTLFRILKNFVSIAILIVVIMLMLSELGIEIGPLIAAAGVVGLAVGFGSQTLVKDIITGLFIILEGQITIGDIVEVAGHSGRVEAITIRTVRLRDVNGHLHVVPFSEVTTVKNITQDQDYHSFEIGVSYNEDVDHVIDTIEKVGLDLQKDKFFKSKINGEIEVFGLDKFEDSSIIIKGRIPTVHKQQWVVRREFNRRIKLAFDKSGIEIPFPQTTISYLSTKKKPIKNTVKKRKEFSAGSDDD
ncbi:MAG: mechanosensitive ion channel protein MscS [Pelagibacteraceae bacterium]|nr:mechanosensitive ion channel protein MscS [Pelagibacteraceae bacterium]|tara:strand:- start:315 stop:1214 length:900 start_codon:yes stop_codon:yes gene_type:complete